MDNNNPDTQTVAPPSTPAAPPPPTIPPPPSQRPNQSVGMPSFSLGEAFKASWTLTLKNVGFFITVVIGSIVIAIGSVTAFIASLAIINVFINLKAFVGPLGIAIGLFLFIIQIKLILGYIRASLKIVDNQKPEFADLFREFKKVFPYIIATILYIFIVIGGLILLIIPGIIFAIRLSQYSYLIVDRKVGIIDSFKISWAITKGSVVKLILFEIIAGLLYLFGNITFGIGLILAIPIVLISSAYIYRKLSLQTPIA